ncbi:glycosyltransferase family 2 protein, partial [Actinomyces sp. AC-18-1]|nr:glycosyltransferase family 2 protein [Actinomyces sp. 187325]
ARRVRRDRRRLAALTTVRRDVLAQLYLPASQIRATRRDLRRQEREREARAAAPSELEVRELAALARRRRRALGATLLAASAVALVGTSGVLVTRAVTGGALAALGGWQETWHAAWSTWAASGDGYPSGVSPFLAVLVPPLLVGSWAGLDAGALIHLLLLLAVPLAALGAWFAAGTITRRTSLRAWAALVWSLAPALLLAVGQGRLGPVLVHLALPWALTALSRAVGADRRDVVLSGLVGAHHVSERERAELDRFASETVASLAELAGPGEEATDPDDGPGATARAAGPGTPREAPRARALALAELVGLADDPQADGGAASGQDEDAGTEPATRPATAGTAGRNAPSRSAAASLEDADDPTEHDQRGGPVDDDPATPVTDDAREIVVSARTAHGAAVRAAATEQYGPGSASAAAAAGLLLSLVVAAVPSTALLLLPGLLLLALLARRSRARLLLTLAPVAATAAPLLWRAGERAAAAGGPAGWHEALRYLLTDWGAPLAVPGASGTTLLLGSPVRLTALVEALAATRTVTGIGTEVGSTGSVLATGWAGTGLSVMTAGLLASALAGADAARSSLVRHTFGWRHITLGVLGVVAVLVPLLVGGSWALAAQHASATGRADLVMALTPSSRQVPVIAAEITASDAAGRVLVLTSTEEGTRVRLWHGDGTSYTDTAPDVLLAQLRTRAEGWEPLETPSAPGGQRPAAAVTGTHLDPADADLAGLVVRAVTGQDEQVADALAAHGVAVVLLTDRPGDEATAAARAGLDATPGLEPLAATSTGTSWRVSPTTATEAAAVRLRGADGASEVIASAAGTARTRLSAADTERTLVLAERSDPAWSATLD